MEIAILYAIWLNANCSIGVDHYVFKGSIYYTDMAGHMEGLYKKFTESNFYKKSLPGD